MQKLLWIVAVASLVGCGPEEPADETAYDPRSGGEGGARDDRDGGMSGAVGDPGWDDSDTDEEPNGEDFDDPYCPAAWAGFEHLDEFIALTNEVSLDPDASGAKIRENGAAAVESAEEMGRHFSRASDFVIDSEMSAHFDALLLYQQKWMLPQANLAAGANDADDYSQKSLDLLLEEGVAQAVSDGAVASGAISAYTLERCGSNRWP